MIETKSKKIKVNNHTGTWYVIDEATFINVSRNKAEKLFLLEHEEYGDMAECVIVDENGKLVAEEIFNGFDDLEDFGEWIEEVL